MKLSENELRNALSLLSQQFMERQEKLSATAELLPKVGVKPDLREDLITDLRAQIRESRYSIPCEDVAKMLLARCLADMVRL